MSAVAKFENLKDLMVEVRGQSVLLDSDVAQIYGVETRDINKAVNNNPDKFPAGYVVELSKQQKGELVENFHRFNKMRNIFARSVRNELKFLPMDVASDKTLSALSPNVPTSTPGNREKLSDRIDRIVQDLFFFPESADQKPVNPVNPV